MHFPAQIQFFPELRQFLIDSEILTLDFEILTLQRKNAFLQIKDQLNKIAVIRFPKDFSNLCQGMERIDRHDGISRPGRAPSRCSQDFLRAEYSGNDMGRRTQILLVEWTAKKTRRGEVQG